MDEIDEITIGCIRTDRPPYNTPPDGKIWWAYMIEDSCDGCGTTAAEAIGNLIMTITTLYNGHPMPYIKKIEWEGKHLTVHQRSTVNRAICQKWLESERGWGVRPDGFSLHLTLDGRKAYIDNYTNERGTGVVPDEYDRPDGEPFSIYVTQEIFEMLVRKTNIRSWNRDNDLRQDGLVKEV